jgi:hypothetical protein
MGQISPTLLSWDIFTIMTGFTTNASTIPNQALFGRNTKLLYLALFYEAFELCQKKDYN